MKIVTNITNKSISISRIIILPKNNHIWRDEEITFELSRKLLKLQSLGMIIVQDIEDTLFETPSIIVEEPKMENTKNTKEEIEELKAKGAKGVKNKKKSTRKKGE